MPRCPPDHVKAHRAAEETAQVDSIRVAQLPPGQEGGRGAELEREASFIRLHDARAHPPALLDACFVFRQCRAWIDDTY